jgi:hypothetical protein
MFQRAAQDPTDALERKEDFVNRIHHGINPHPS